MHSSSGYRRHSGKTGGRYQRGHSAKQRYPNKTAKQCTRCGKEQHPRDKCPAKEATCHKCQKKGHYSAHCFTKSLSEVKITDNFLDTVSTSGETSWLITVQLEGKETSFKLDTGAEVTAVSEKTFTLLGKPGLKAPSQTLYGPSQQPLEIVGQFIGNFSYNRKSTKQPVFVVRGLKTNLLGLPAITAMKLAARVDATSTGESILEKFPSVFKGLGTLGGPYEIEVKPEAKPYSLFVPRRVPLPLRQKVQQELDRMESIGVISKVDKPTPWCAGMVVVPKKTGAVRICVDLKPLNQNVLREVHPLPRVDETLAQLHGARIFSKLDANSGFWQIPLAEKSRLLTTFVTPSGRYCFNKLPFGISSAPELFQKRMNQILTGLEGVLCLMDDVLVFGKDQSEHDVRLMTALKRVEVARVTLNPEKCEFGKTKIKFLGHLIDEEGIRADPEKTSAIVKMKPPTDVSGLRRFLGMVNQLGKFSKDLAELTKPLRELLSNKCTWLWGPAQDEAFQQVKSELIKPTILALYNPETDTIVSADASSYGLGAVLLQKSDSTWKPVVYASRSMTETECHYAQIEKEALATTWACEKFTPYILGKTFTIQTDHKPLVPLLGSKNLDILPPRILRFRLRMDRFDYSIVHVPGKLLYTADTLSRAPMSESETNLQEEAEVLMEVCVTDLPASNSRLDEYRASQVTDPICSAIFNYCRNGWPVKDEVEAKMRPYWIVRGELTVCKDLLLYRRQIVVPKSLQQQTLKKIHSGHQGIERCRLRAKSSVWWPGISHEINNLVKQCIVCAKEITPHKEPLIPTQLPNRPWQRVGSDLFTLGRDNYLLVIDYFSRYPEVIKLTSTTSSNIISALKSIFSRHGIPETLVSDNGPQYSSREFTAFAKSYDFCHITSSPYFAQSNGQAERTVKTMKKLLKTSDDHYMALLSYRTTPLPWCNISPAQLLMGRQIRTNLPQLGEILSPSWPYLEEFRCKNKEFKNKQKRDYDQRHRATTLPLIPDDSNVWVTTGDRQVPGQVVTVANAPRSYVVNTSSGQIRRNRIHLNPIPENRVQRSSPHQPRSPIMTRTRTGTTIRPPQRL